MFLFILGIAEIATSSNKMNNLYNFPQSNRSSEADEDEERERETETEEDEDEDDELTTCNKMLLNNHLKADELVNLESFNLDTHLDLKRYMYFNNPQQVILITAQIRFNTENIYFKII